MGDDVTRPRFADAAGTADNDIHAAVAIGSLHAVARRDLGCHQLLPVPAVATQRVAGISRRERQPLQAVERTHVQRRYVNEPDLPVRIRFGQAPGEPLQPCMRRIRGISTMRRNTVQGHHVPAQTARFVAKRNQGADGTQRLQDAALLIGDEAVFCQIDHRLCGGDPEQAVDGIAAKGLRDGGDIVVRINGDEAQQRVSIVAFQQFPLRGVGTHDHDTTAGGDIRRFAERADRFPHR